MTDIALRVENLSKQYRIGQRESYKALRDTITDAIYAPFRRLRSYQLSAVSCQPNYIWALKGVSFEVKRGEVVGVIGRNGAGKTTLLKVLSRITEPTEGFAEIHGRVGCLLEVGTGFHPELTGRENIYLSGTILGMKKAEIEAKFDEIVSFAGVEKFIDTPVKRYSSGMYVRLAFAVAAYLEPEILLVDEVLAVGDAEFQRKCIGKMQDVAGEGRTVLFVSHNMASIAQLCQRGLFLDGGKIVKDDEIREVIETYVASGQYSQAEVMFPDNPAKLAQIRQIQILNDQGCPSSELDRAKPFQVAIQVEAHEPVKGTLVFSLETAQGVRLCMSACADVIREYSHFIPKISKRFIVTLPGNLFNEGSYKFVVWVVPGNSGEYDRVISPLFSLLSLTGRDSFIGERKKDPSVLHIPLEWKIEKED